MVQILLYGFSLSEKICEDIEGYYNQNGWLEGVETTCNESNGNVVTEFVGSS